MADVCAIPFAQRHLRERLFAQKDVCVKHICAQGHSRREDGKHKGIPPIPVCKSRAAVSCAILSDFFDSPDRTMTILQFLNFPTYSPSEGLSNGTSLGSKFDCEFTDFLSNCYSEPKKRTVRNCLSAQLSFRANVF